MNYERIDEPSRIYSSSQYKNMFEISFSYKENRKPNIKAIHNSLMTKISENYVDLKTIDEANCWAKENLIIPNIDYTGMDIVIANLYNKELKVFQTVLPEALKDINWICTDDTICAVASKDTKWCNQMIHKVNVQKKAKIRNGEFNKIVDICFRGHKQSFARYSNKNKYKKYSGVFLLNGFTKSSDIVNNITEYNIQLGELAHYHSNIEGLLRHELSHNLFNQLVLNTSFRIYGQQELVDILYQHLEIFNSFKSIDSNTNIDVIADMFSLSKYASINIQELFAEGYAEYLGNPEPRWLAKKIGLMVDKYLNEYRSKKK